MISEFRGKYYFLSNFYSSPVYYRGMTFQNAEAAFHSQKDPARIAEFTRLNPSEAKRLGRRVRLRRDWEEVKDGIMFAVIMAKFGSSQSLADALLATGNEKLVEGNTLDRLADSHNSTKQHYKYTVLHYFYIGRIK